MPLTKFYLLPYTRCADNAIESSLGLSTPKKMYGVIERDDQVISLHHLTIRNMLQSGLINEDYLSLTLSLQK